MTFRLFIYYSALCGAWAAMLAWTIVKFTGLMAMDSAILKTMLIAALLGSLVGAAIGFIDALLNKTGSQRYLQAGVCLVIGFFGGMVGGLVGQGFANLGAPFWLGWMLVGVLIGASVGLFDLFQALTKKADTRLPRTKTLNGVYGGLAGGLIGGLLFGLAGSISQLKATDNLIGDTGLAVGLVLLGASIGLLIGLAQVFLKEAWLRVEQGRRSGRQLVLAKEETTIGRAEGCDLGLFGEKGIEKLHARIVMHNNRYYVEDENTPGGTYVNDVRVNGRAPLQAGDRIRLGSCVVRFDERQKR